MELVKQLKNLFSKKSDNQFAKKILIIDDDQICLNSNKSVAKEFDCEADIFLANTGKQALKLLQEENFDLVILDLGLPDITGIEVLSIISRKKDNSKNIIVLTAYDEQYMRIACKKLNALSYIKKPLNIEKLKNTLKSNIIILYEFIPSITLF